MKGYIKLPKEIKTKWLKALRSGKYKQGKRRLKTGNCYCCLGVLASELGCEITNEVILTDLHCDNIKTDLKLVFTQINKNGEVIQRYLASKNDKEKNWSFKRIATWIEKYL